MDRQWSWTDLAVVLLATAACLAFAWVGYLDSDDKNHLAGAFGWSIGGPRLYDGHVVEDAWMGDGRNDLQAEDIRHALRLLMASGAVLSVLLAIGFALVRWAAM